ncbi:Putative RxLR effector [Phytophthora palmivora]|uniref:RxLR effector n=1 Tax=Phytophthora palmivora TaxID=4796 RepID=A0A2P4XSM6_9STRA|nr:Putative RxLR effector [Phytophthora palmivora]
MASPRRFALPLYAVMLVMICMASFVTSHLELTDGMAELPRQALSTDMSEKATTTMRFLRGGDTNDNVNNEVAGSEERGFQFLDDAIGNAALKLGLKISLRLNDTPHKVLNDLQRHRVPMNEQNMLLWLGYVLNYRGKMGNKFYADDEYVVKTLSEFIPKSHFSVLFKAMEKNDKLRAFAEDLQKVM